MHRSVRTNEVGIEATSVYDGTEGSIADTSYAESSFLSSHPSNVISKKLEDDDNPKVDLNDTRTETFPTDSETGFGNNSEELQRQNMSFQTEEPATKILIEPPQEDMPSFREWTEKHLAEKEKERGIFQYLTLRNKL